MKGDRITRFGSLKGGEIDIESVYLFVLEHSQGENPIEFSKEASDQAIQSVLKLEEK
jgi:hypothetical protein